MSQRNQTSAPSAAAAAAAASGTSAAAPVVLTPAAAATAIAKAKIDFVQMDALVLLKILKHCQVSEKNYI